MLPRPLPARRFASAALAILGLMAVTLQAQPLLEEVVITATPLRKLALETAQPVSVLAGDALAVRREGSLGETLADQPGVSASAFGPIASRPIIRGQGGLRVQTYQDGADTLDVAALSDDHAVTLEPMLADRIEIVRGPAALLFGSAAAAGAINVVTPRLSLARFATPFGGEVQMRGDTAANERGVAARLGGHVTEALQFSGDLHHFRADELRIPNGELENSDGETRGGSVGFGWVDERTSLAIAVSGLRSQYGLPSGSGHEDVRLDLHQRRVDLAGEWQLEGLFDALRLRVADNDYEHVELEGEEIGSTYAQRGREVRLSADRNGRWSIGIQWRELDFDAEGEEAFLPMSTTRHLGAFAFGQYAIGALAFESGLRFEHQAIELKDARYRAEALSGSVGAQWRVTETWTTSLQVTSSARHPTATELYAFGPHLAAQRFEIGDANLGIERGLTADLSLRHRSEDDWQGSIGLFMADYDNFIAALPDGSVEDALRVTRFSATDARFEGVEFDWSHDALFTIGSGRFGARLFGDYVKAQDRYGSPLPQIPPRRLGLEIGFVQGPLRVGVETIHHDEQNEVADGETPTAGFTALNAEVAYRLAIENTDMLWFVRGVNLLNEEMRRHASPLKDVAPLAARHLSIGLQLKF